MKEAAEIRVDWTNRRKDSSAMTIFDSLFQHAAVRNRHKKAPLYRERAEYLTHVQALGRQECTINLMTSYLLHVNRVLGLSKQMRRIEIGELENAGRKWETYTGPLRRRFPGKTTYELFMQLNRFGLAYLHIIEPRIKGNVLISEGQGHVAAARLRKIFTGKIIAAGGFEPDTAEAAVREGDADLVAFGRHFVANPDLPKRIRLGLPLNAYDRDTFYTFEARGYTDYPFYKRRSESVASTL